jgi:hypothetical protein
LIVSLLLAFLAIATPVRPNDVVGPVGAPKAQDVVGPVGLVQSVNTTITRVAV